MITPVTTTPMNPSDSTMVWAAFQLWFAVSAWNLWAKNGRMPDTVSAATISATASAPNPMIATRRLLRFRACLSR